MNGMKRSSGISLAEVLVAITVLGLATTIALVLFDGTRRSFKVGNNLTEQQQVVRIAFDKLSRDVAMAGFNYNPDGSKNLSDEAIEVALDTALVLRADFDAGDPAQSQTPESALASAGNVLSVSIGNDEIVGYLLAKPGGLGPDAFSFSADVLGVPRDRVVDAIDVSNVTTAQDDPPYTLYRITIDANSTAVRRVPLVDNVRRLRFTYYDSRGNVVPAPGGAEDDLSRTARRAIQRIGVEIEGLTRDPDSRWIDRDDLNPLTREYRKFELFGDITPLNLGLFGVEDLEASLSPPSKPSPPILSPGHCRGLWMEWEPSPPQEEVARYEIRHGKSPTTLTGLDYAVVPQHYLAPLDDGTEYYVTVQAVDYSGSVSLPSEPASEVTGNENWPAQPTGLAASSNLESVVHLSWDAVSDNALPSPPAADPLSPKMRDFYRYRIHRAVAAGFLPDYSTNLLGEQVQTTLDDHKVVNCRPYYYRVIAADECAADGELHPSDEIQGQSYTIVAPEAPLNVQAYFLPAAGDDVHLIWDPVTRDVAGNPVYIDSYRILRADLGVPTAYAYVDDVFLGVTEWVDVAPPPLVGYKVQAYDACPNFSAESEEALPSCDFNGVVAFTKPAGDTVEVGDFIRVQLTGSSGTHHLEVKFVRAGVEVHQMDRGTGPPWGQFTWPVEAGTPGTYRLDAIVTRLLNDCVQRRSIYVDLE